jgi:hypothetical protein
VKEWVGTIKMAVRTNKSKSKFAQRILVYEIEHSHSPLKCILQILFRGIFQKNVSCTESAYKTNN